MRTILFAGTALIAAAATAVATSSVTAAGAIAAAGGAGMIGSGMIGARAMMVVSAITGVIAGIGRPRAIAG